MPMEDSARAACVSRTFMRSWRHHPYLILSNETLGLIDLILKNHSGTGIKTLKLDVYACSDLNACYLNDWLQIAITPTIESLTLQLPSEYEHEYDFPCSLLFGVNGNLIRHLHLNYCAFRPTVGTGCLISLTKLHLDHVCITGEELGCLLSSSLASMQLKLEYCDEIICLKIPCMLEQLSRLLTVSDCSMLRMIESQAPNLMTLDFDGDNLVQLGQSLQVKNLVMDFFDATNFLNYSVTKLPNMVPNLETLTLFSYFEMLNTPTVVAKFHHLKYLKIYMVGGDPGYDFCSLGSVLDAAPVLETFILCVIQTDMEFDPVFWDASNMRQTPEHKYKSLKNVMIFGFFSDKSLVELTCHILENATSLESIILDTVYAHGDNNSFDRCIIGPARCKCCFLLDAEILKANKGVIAIQKYIAEKVPFDVKLDVRGPCRRQCHTSEP
ncbi:hypothetical protein HU200_040613 [Digitaria exilis]|uniref:At1g61320/AtMIF1 LRR domain-containing protein n=1 Tax=Digitaria exilis TaxID=1010633 RepID=A0A835BAQ8_9POAL|nr:hypothetical protein HU200_040613 [Digitaria exilis]